MQRSTLPDLGHYIITKYIIIDTNSNPSLVCNRSYLVTAHAVCAVPQLHFKSKNFKNFSEQRFSVKNLKKKVS